ncbi:NAD(P)H-binding protein [Leucobacter sp. CSA2]|uniref:NAD(P)H-binding protein n=1 Tax=Leucobacter edaphi TaxID=2796472 RepID=A0A934QC07_9MICO|nr:NAD(P)H-binding protein [Leucobacter edaphi]MBK0421393.1 NAD(P)H-binding protein [Leucobacter edaphi]
MTVLTVIGGSGYAGGHIVEAAAVRGLQVRSMSRGEAAEQIAGVTYETGSILDEADRARALEGSDVVVVAISPRGSMAGKARGAVAAIAREAADRGVRLGVIGGAGSLLDREGGSRLFESPDFNADYLDEAKEMSAVLDDLRAMSDAPDWFLVSPAGDFGPWVAGEYTGTYRVGGDVLLTDENGRSAISGADFGVAVVDEIENPSHHRARFTVAY